MSPLTTLSEGFAIDIDSSPSQHQGGLWLYPLRTNGDLGNTCHMIRVNEDGVMIPHPHLPIMALKTVNGFAAIDAWIMENLDLVEVILLRSGYTPTTKEILRRLPLMGV